MCESTKEGMENPFLSKDIIYSDYLLLCHSVELSFSFYFFIFRLQIAIISGILSTFVNCVRSISSHIYVLASNKKICS